MFNKHSYNAENGFIRIGGTPASGDPFIDVKNFMTSSSGGGSKLFGSEIGSDLKYRDFACNAIYYDPVNKRLIDPTGVGIADATNKHLTIIKDQFVHSPFFSGGQMVIRMIKFVTRGYAFNPETIQVVKAEFCPLLHTMESRRRMGYINAQVLSKVDTSIRQDTYDKFVQKMNEIGFDEEYEKLIKPFENILRF
jgi:tRNA nucleotidyltransferase/poly(A) polymerase